MASFQKGGAPRGTFGGNEYLRSTEDVKKESYTVSALSVPSETIEGSAQKLLYPGTVMAKITSGSEAGKIGPYQAAGTNEVQTITKSGTVSGGTYTLTVDGETTAAIPYDATASQIKTAIAALAGVEADDITVTGGPLHSTPVVVTFVGVEGGRDVPAITIDTTALTGSTPGASVAQTTQGVAGATDGRQTAANIVGINDTFLPWQLLERDVEVAVAYECTAVQGWCFELNAAGVRQVLSNTTADAMRGVKGLDVHFK